jgi:hypothetical protein
MIMIQILYRQDKYREVFLLSHHPMGKKIKGFLSGPCYVLEENPI